MKGTLKLKLATLAVILAAAILVPMAWAGEASATLTSDTSATALTDPISGQPGVFIPVAFYVEVDVEGTAGGPRGSTPRVVVCNQVLLHADGSFSCEAYHTFSLVRGHNYNTGADSNGLSFPQYVQVQLTIEEGIDCPQTYSLLEGLTTPDEGMDFGDGVKFLNLPFQVEVSCDTDWQGCGHGYWKNHTQSWQVHNFGDMVSDVFAWPYADMTLLQAMQFTGPGNTVEDASRILLQQAVASLLNADHSDVNFPMDAASLIAAVNAALASGDRDAILALKDDLDTKNNLGCPLN